jgi:hypothetical protein
MVLLKQAYPHMKDRNTGQGNDTAVTREHILHSGSICAGNVGYDLR